MGIPRPNAGHAALINKSPLKRFIWYFLITSLLVALPSLILLGGYENASVNYVIFIVFALITGFFHVFFINEKLKWGDRSVLAKKISFTAGVMFCSMLLFYLLCRFLILKNVEGYSELYISALLAFIIPFFVVASFDKAMNIQPRKYKLWFFNDNINAQDPDLIDFSNSYLLSFEFPKKYNDTIISNFKFKAPVDMHFGELFYNYIKEYNDAHRENPIEYQDALSDSYGWLFSIKKRAWWQKERILDPHLTIRQNKILEHDVILPKRFIVA
ncbi:MAG: hypothetical protein IPP51_15215 [Bacteroidetes bacterium]|nr:hypothetical protein [Bacteroidota bacterium]